jgi:hypothetical protein
MWTPPLFLIFDGVIARNSAGYVIFSMASILPRCWSAEEAEAQACTIGNEKLRKMTLF